LSNPQLQVRIPREHWIWEVEDPEKRRREVMDALNFYRRWRGRVAEAAAAAAEIRRLVRERAAGAAESRPRLEEDERFLASLDRLLSAIG
jgi:hypothetical protein